MNDFGTFIQWAFQAVLTGSIVYGISVLSRMGRAINEINVNIAKINEKLGWHEKTLDIHHTRLSNMEKIRSSNVPRTEARSQGN